ncbi:hypothetical protein ACFL2Z_04575 [Candidatus Eisenbacteria bacterium]|uniref:Uncharacterized protein n=1 Tax=Eiseniibacteriota bacterium TaxID=2212470 RepID=A0ABV6YQ16_UNCEI
MLLVGEGAEKFAAEIGARKADLLTEEKRAEHEEWYQKHQGYEKHLIDTMKHSVDSQSVRGTSVIRAGTARAVVAYMKKHEERKAVPRPVPGL